MNPPPATLDHITCAAGPLGFVVGQATPETAQLTPNQIKHRLRRQGKILKDFARENGFQYRTVSDVVRGLRQGNYGEGREVRLKLGLPVKD
ncbi:MAG TPA: DNA-binding protein [Acidovorax sp.]|jgi:gp16 family phage-associated protein|nr:DNA-binding protein [Acidovorax sp.]